MDLPYANPLTDTPLLAFLPLPQSNRHQQQLAKDGQKHIQACRARHTAFRGKAKTSSTRGGKGGATGTGGGGGGGSGARVLAGGRGGGVAKLKGSKASRQTSVFELLGARVVKQEQSLA